MTSTTKSYLVIASTKKSKECPKNKANNPYAKYALVPMEWLQGKQWTSFRDNGSDEMNFFEATQLTKTRWWAWRQTQPECDDGLRMGLRDWGRAEKGFGFLIYVKTQHRFFDKTNVNEVMLTLVLSRNWC